MFSLCVAHEWPGQGRRKAPLNFGRRSVGLGLVQRDDPQGCALQILTPWRPECIIGVARPFE
eukprot:3395741-Prymnesium_polylepis.1